ncbi:hypothetical protein [Arcanobacterium hippocoleae]|uniref:Uncharacterized protein n=1 Tax=Arcanobacterium hippocoleae TaxID=149017 RepID=A0ABU1T1M4_9ACTO|nr:hypothetical protein [Arcanobacterium hippocoleae]MDR6939223.1 hypothetical protein [Arcanobacterium hippocoleae]
MENFLQKLRSGECVHFVQIVAGGGGREQWDTLEFFVDCASEDTIFGFAELIDVWAGVEIDFDGNLVYKYGSYATLDEALNDEWAFDRHVY